ncbi:hypothetical protein [Pseudomonas tohonis]|uniref:hypothetical protein n=1 Tax=Pseudomonas tohonis TaxID=2725477 RepID=UPI0021DB684A|nr:hypothetical protein [Pseudomonas tohonis]UXY50689.1 hypothetical protein N9L84_17095 [Pseudomonas tohonis]
MDERHAACHPTDFLNLSGAFALPNHGDTRKQETTMAIRNQRTTQKGHGHGNLSRDLRRASR